MGLQQTFPPPPLSKLGDHLRTSYALISLYAHRVSQHLEEAEILIWLLEHRALAYLLSTSVLYTFRQPGKESCISLL